MRKASPPLFWGALACLLVGLVLFSWMLVNAQSPVFGQWTTLANLPFFPVHAHLLPTGKVMIWAGDTDPTAPHIENMQQWDPANQILTPPALPGWDLFCSGHTFLADGRLFVAGGHIQNGVGSPKAGIYNPSTNTWATAPDMNAGRWYPTVTTLANGDALVVSGSLDSNYGVNTLPQVYQVATNTWRSLTNAQLAMDLYPMMFLAPNGQVFNPAPTATTRYLNTSGTGAWSFVANRTFTDSPRTYGSAVMYAAGKILVLGGGDPPTNTAEVIDLNQPSPTWRAVAPMSIARRQVNATLLPDGTVLVTGGTSGPGFNNETTPVYPAELWDPATETWQTLASATVPRLYHSAATLLPDGRVLSTGGNNYVTPETFSPPYLFKGARPTMSGVPATIGYGQHFSVQSPDAATITKVTLIRITSVTHAFNMNQRLNVLSFTPGSGTLDIVAPATANIAPPGHYLLFLVKNTGVPSVGSVVRLDALPPGPTLSALAPSAAPAGGSAFTLTVTGANFVSGATVRWNGGNRTTTFVSASQLTAAIPATDIAGAGTAQVTVVNPNGGLSNALTFTTTSTSCPCSIWPSTATPAVAANPDPSSLEIGVRFQSDSAGYIKGIRFYKGSGNAGPHTGKLWTATGTLLASATFSGETASGWQEVRFATPVAITANTTYVASYYAPSGFFSYTVPYFTSQVYSPPLRALADGSGGGNGLYQYGTGGFPTSTSSSANYWVDVVFDYTAASGPTLSALAPSAAQAGGSAFTLTVTGANFVSGATVRWNGTARTTTFVSASQLTAAIPATDIASAGTAPVTVVNPGGSLSNALTFTTTPGPTLSALAPSAAPAGGPAFTLTVTGANFVSGATVRWNGTARTTTFVSASQLTAAIPATDIASVGTAPVTVVNPGGSLSNALTFTTTSGPTLSALAPSAAQAGGSAFTLTVTGANFVSGATVRWNGTARTTTFVSASQLTAAIPATDIASAGTAPVTVVNPGGSLSNALTFTTTPGPTLSALAPSAAPAGGPAFTLTVTGANFVSGATVRWNGTARTTTFVSASQLTAAIPATDIASVGTAPVTVVNPGGSLSNALTFTTTAASTLCPCSIWPSTATPAVAANPDLSSVEIGVRFQSDSAGYIKGIRFYKGSGNAGPHTGKLWTATGTLLASATFSGETTSGWQEVRFATPVAITANTTYVASYYAPSGFFSYTAPYFTAQVSSPPLRALANGDGGGNGVYRYGAGGGFPTLTFNSANYWVDVVFDSTAASAPTLSALAPSAAPAGGPAFTLTVTGANFVSGATVRWNGTTRTTTFVSAGQLTAAILAADITVAGTALVTVINPDGGVSPAPGLTFTTTPGPTLSALAPSAAPAGGPAFTLTVTGANFVSGATVRWNGTARTTTFVSASQLTAAILVTDIASPGTAQVTVANPDGGVSPALTFTTNPAPTLSALAPSAAPAGGPAFTLTVTGANFVSGATVRWNGTARTTTFVSASQLTAAILAADITVAGTALVTVANPDGGVSPAPGLTFTTTPAPTLSALAPSAAPAGGPAFTLTVTGANFVSGATVRWNGTARTTTFVSASQLTAAILATDITVAGTALVTVANPDGGVSPAPGLTFTTTPAPTLSALAPSAAPAGGPAFTLTVTGANFVSGATVRWNGTARTTTFVSASQLTAAILATDITVAGTAQVTVANPDGGVSPAPGLTFTTTPAPTLSALAPSAAPAGGPAFTLTVTGANFVSGATVRWNGTARTTTFVSASQLTAAILATDITVAGTALVTVANPDGGVSPAPGLTFTTTPAPTLSALAPSAAPAGGPAFTLTVTGANFVSGATVRWNGTARTTTFVSASQLTAAILAADITVAGTALVTVINPDGGVSPAPGLTFTTTPGPTLSALAPSAAPAGGPAFTLTVTGANFVSGATVRWNGTARTTTFVSASQLTAAILVTDITVAGTALVTVANPDGGVSPAPGLTFTANPAPTLSALAPSAAPAGGPAFTLTVTGANFVSGATVRWNGTARTTTFVSASQLTAAILATDITVAGTAQVTVANPDGGVSPAPGLTFTANPAPTLSALAPSAAPAGGPAFTLTVTGANFVSGATVRWNGTVRTTTFVSASQLTAAILATDITVAGTAQVTVANPDGGVSPAPGLTFTTTPGPTLSALAPSAAPAGGPAFTLTVTGANFVSGATVRWNGTARTTTFVSASQLTAAIGTADITVAGTALVTVANPDGGVSPAPGLTFTTTPGPTLSALAPSAAPAGGPAFTLTVTGANFVSGATVRWNGTARTTTFVSASQLTAAILVTDITVAGTAQVTVANPDGGVSPAPGLTFTANPAPTLSALAPSAAPAGGPAFTLTVTGANFVSGATVRWNGTARTTTFVSASQLTAAILATDITVAGTAQVTVINPDGGVSPVPGLTFTTTPAPTLSALAPSAAPAGGPAFTLTVTGANFVSGATVRWNGTARTTTFVSASQLTAAILAADITVVGTAQVTVANPGGSPSNALLFTTSCPCSIWPSTATPAVAANPDPSSLEIGVRFRSDSAGYIKGIRFYKGSGNAGPHTGKLWTATGTLLASATFSGETASGWQEVRFATPVAITANTTYVASYYAPSGFFSYTSPYFTAQVSSPPLRALANGDGGGNGVYRYGAGGGFPTLTFNSANYWVDVVFDYNP